MEQARYVLALLIVPHSLHYLSATAQGSKPPTASWDTSRRYPSYAALYRRMFSNVPLVTETAVVLLGSAGSGKVGLGCRASWDTASTSSSSARLLSEIKLCVKETEEGVEGCQVQTPPPPPPTPAPPLTLPYSAALSAV